MADLRSLSLGTVALKHRLYHFLRQPGDQLSYLRVGVGRDILSHLGEMASILPLHPHLHTLDLSTAKTSGLREWTPLPLHFLDALPPTLTSLTLAVFPMERDSSIRSFLRSGRCKKLEDFIVFEEASGRSLNLLEGPHVFPASASHVLTPLRLRRDLEGLGEELEVLVLLFDNEMEGASSLDLFGSVADPCSQINFSRRINEGGVLSRNTIRAFGCSFPSRYTCVGELDAGRPSLREPRCEQAFSAPLFRLPPGSRRAKQEALFRESGSLSALLAGELAGPPREKMRERRLGSLARSLLAERDRPLAHVSTTGAWLD